MSPRRIAKEVVAWLLAIFLFTVFFRAGIAKFDDASGWARSFQRWGFPVWFRVAIGVIEAAAALLILWPRTAAYGAAAMAAVMIGAIGTFVVNGTMHPTPIVTLVWVTIVLLLRWRQRIGGQPRQSQSAINVPSSTSLPLNP